MIAFKFRIILNFTFNPVLKSKQFKRLLTIFGFILFEALEQSKCDPGVYAFFDKKKPYLNSNDWVLKGCLRFLTHMLFHTGCNMPLELCYTINIHSQVSKS